MAKNSTITTTNQIYRARAELTFDYNENKKENRIVIDKQFIHFIAITDDYMNNVLPVIYVSISAEDSLYKKIHNYKESAKFILTMYKYIYNAKNKVPKKIFTKSFAYIPSTTEANPWESLNEAAEGRDSYRKITLGLVSDTMTDQLRKEFNGVYKKTDQSSLITLALEGLKTPIIEKIDTNKKYDQIIIPPLNTRYQLLKFLFTDNPFYDTGFRFYMDFNKTYLLSNKGRKISGGDGYPDEILFNIVNLIDPTVAEEGMSITDENYTMNLIPTAIEMLENNAMSKTTNKLVAVDEDGDVSDLDLDLGDDSDVKPKTIYSRTIASDAVKNEIEMNRMTITVNKLNVDPTVLTPNKLITVKNYADNSNFNGTYMLCNKQQIFMNTNGEFTIQLFATLRKVGKLNKPIIDSRTKEKVYKKTTNKAVKSTSRRKTTASMKTK